MTPMPALISARVAQSGQLARARGECPDENDDSSSATDHEPRRTTRAGKAASVPPSAADQPYPGIPIHMRLFRCRWRITTASLEQPFARRSRAYGQVLEDRWVNGGAHSRYRKR